MNVNTSTRTTAEVWERGVELAIRQETRTHELDEEELRSAVGLRLHTQLHAGTYYYFGAGTPQPAPVTTHGYSTNNLYYNYFRYF